MIQVSLDGYTWVKLREGIPNVLHEALLVPVELKIISLYMPHRFALVLTARGSVCVLLFDSPP